MQTEYKTKRKPKPYNVILNYGCLGAAQHELWWRQAVSFRWWRQAVSLCWWRQAVSPRWCVAWPHERTMSGDRWQVTCHGFRQCGASCNPQHCIRSRYSHAHVLGVGNPSGSSIPHRHDCKELLLGRHTALQGFPQPHPPIRHRGCR